MEKLKKWAKRQGPFAWVSLAISIIALILTLVNGS